MYNRLGDIMCALDENYDRAFTDYPDYSHCVSSVTAARIRSKPRKSTRASNGAAPTPFEIRRSVTSSRTKRSSKPKLNSGTKQSSQFRNPLKTRAVH